MDLSGIITISGKPGLYVLVAQSKNGIIVESVNDGKRFPAYASHRISALEDISIYTYDDDVPLSEIYRMIFEKEDGGLALTHKSSGNELREYLGSILPKFDEERVYTSDIKKLLQWYNILHEKDLLKKKEEATEDEAKSEEEAAPKTEAVEDAAEETAAPEASSEASDEEQD